jgi:hypothetical protein
MSIPYEILIRGNAGAFQGSHAIDNPGDDARPLQESDLALFGQGINTALLAEIERLKTEHAAEIARIQGLPASGEVSKLTLMRRLDALGKWGAFKSLLAQLPEIAQDAWTLAQAIRADDPIFVTYAETIKASLGLTDEQFTALLA